MLLFWLRSREWKWRSRGRIGEEFHSRLCCSHCPGWSMVAPPPFTRSRILPATQAIRPCGGSVASWSLSSLGLTPGWGHCVVFLGKTLCSHIASLHLQICSSGKFNTESIHVWTSIPSQAGRGEWEGGGGGNNSYMYTVVASCRNKNKL